MELSKTQQKIVDMRDHNILVSAAAGSGKTRVLVERILSRLRDHADPIDIDQILVLTYTRAAEGEMRDRIAKAIGEIIDNGEADEHMVRQAALVYNAQITTIDSFCLDILRNNFTQIGLEPGFKAAADEEISSLAEEALDEVLEEVLALKDPQIDAFLERFESKDNLRKIKESISATYSKALNAPFVEDYIEERRRDYDIDSAAELFASAWYKDLWQDVCDTIHGIDVRLGEFRDHVETFGPEEYLPICDSDSELVGRLVGAHDLTELAKMLATDISFATLPRKVSADNEVKEAAKALRELYKELIKDLAKRYADFEPNAVADMMKFTDKAVNGLMDVVLKYHECLEKKKRDKGLVTFSDMEHMALKILLVKENGKYVPTQVAKDYRGIYKELMIDEYQDSNYTQEWLIHSISGEDEGIFDRFMVGDIKQSIYRFRNADPSLFSSKYDSYSPDESEDRVRVDLSVNYRSRAEVLDTVNTVFERTFDRYMGGIEYGELHRLNYGGGYDDYPVEGDACKSELMITGLSGEPGISREKQEACSIAARIKRLIKEQFIYDDEVKSMRRCRYKDIVILLRSMSYDVDEMRRTFEQEGIPVHVTSKSGFFDAGEITTVLNYLSIIDNPGKDIPMYGSMMSVFGGFDENDAACLKTLGMKNLYEAMKRLGDSDIDPGEIFECVRGGYAGLKARSADFIGRLQKYRDMVPYTPVYKLLRLIYSDSDYVDHVASLPAGEQKKANVLALLSKAEAFEHDGFRGIFDFNRYIERIHRYEADEGEVMTLDENADVVRIMTMHKSKGLEYPVCILAGLNKKFNMMDSREEVIFHEKYGIGLDYTDAAKRAKYRDLRRRYIADKISLDARSEEMRVLYVAMTRAKEKLIMSATVKDIEEDFKVFEGDPKDRLERKKCASFLDILRLSRGNDDWNGQCSLIPIYPENISTETIREYTNMDSDRTKLIAELTHVSDDDMRAADTMRSKIGYNYPHPELKELYTKTSVSELKMAAMKMHAFGTADSDDGAVELFEHRDTETYIPTFAGENAKAMSGTAVGSAYHRVMELIDYCDTVDFDAYKLDTQMNGYIANGALLIQDYELIKKEKVTDFVNSPLGRRMSKAAGAGMLYREKPFVIGISAGRLNEEFPEEETVLIQGIIDAYFEEDGHIVLLDYKTDAVRTETELIDRYKTQLDYYEEALARLTGKPVSERLLYSFALEKTISC